MPKSYIFNYNCTEAQISISFVVNAFDIMEQMGETLQVNEVYFQIWTSFTFMATNRFNVLVYVGKIYYLAMLKNLGDIDFIYKQAIRCEQTLL